MVFITFDPINKQWFTMDIQHPLRHILEKHGFHVEHVPVQEYEDNKLFIIRHQYLQIEKAKPIMDMVNEECKQHYIDVEFTTLRTY